MYHCAEEGFEVLRVYDRAGEGAVALRICHCAGEGIVSVEMMSLVDRTMETDYDIDAHVWSAVVI